MFPQFTHHLQINQPQKLALYGTSLSYHLAPILRGALTAHFGDLIEVVNAGCPAKASRTALMEVETKLLKHRPDVVTLEFAVNDAYLYPDHPDELDRGIGPEESRANCERLIANIRAALPHCEILLMTMNPAYDSPLNDELAGSRRPNLAQYYEGYREVAAQQGLQLLDAFAWWQTLRRENESQFREYVPDGVHPTPTAYRQFLVPHLLRAWSLTL